MIRLADYVMNQLYTSGCNHVFMITGRGNLYLSDAVARHNEMKGVSVHHEQSAAYAAYAYAQSTGGVGACLVSTGCAATNAITGALCAWQDNVPCVFLSGQNILKETTYYSKLQIRTYGSQETNIVELVKPITKYAVMITDPKDIAYELEKAMYLAISGKKGPVWVDIPIDIQNQRINEEELRHFIPKEVQMNISDDDIDFVKAELERANRPVVFIGSGIRQAGAIDELKYFLRQNRIPLVFSASAVDIIGAADELSIGAVGSMGGSRAGNFVIQNSDLILAIGNRLAPITIGEPYDKFARDAKVIVVDIDEEEHKKDTISIDRFLLADAKVFLHALNKEKIKGNYEKWLDTCMHWKEMFPKCEKRYEESERVDLHYLGKCMSKVMPADMICLTDAGFEELIIPAAIEFKEGQRSIHPVSQGAMGFSLPAAVGAFLATQKTVISINGDGSIMMNLQELQTVRYYNIPIKIIVCNNNCYAVIRKRQQDLFRTRTIGTDATNGVSCPDFSKVAASFDIPYMKIENSGQLYEGLKRLLEQEGPVFCEILCVENQGYLHNSYAMGSNRKIQRRSLEDQSPFMDRDIFLSEMIVEPVDYE